MLRGVEIVDYENHYFKLVEKAMLRELENPLTDYFERHHVIPRCFAEDERTVKLTPEEHYMAHQLLAKWMPEEQGLIFAARMMCMNRPNNKLYGWIRRRANEAQLGNNHWLGKKHSEEAKEKIRNKLKGRKLSEEHIENVRVANTGKKRSPEQCKKIGDIHRGKIVTDETKNKMSESQKGNTNKVGKKVSDETKRKISIANTGYRHTAEAKTKIAEAGRNISDETRRRLSAKQKEVWARRKMERNSEVII